MTFDLMYENLIGVDSQTLEFVPCLARRWAVSDDGRTKMNFGGYKSNMWMKFMSAADADCTFENCVLKGPADHFSDCTVGPGCTRAAK